TTLTPHDYTLPLHDALPIYPRKDQQNSAVPRERPARKPSTRAASYQRDLEAVCQEHDLHDVARRAREDNILRPRLLDRTVIFVRSEEHTSELQSHLNLVCRL